MPSTFLDIVFKTSKKGQGGKAAAQELKEVKATVGEVTSGLLGFNAASLTAAGAIVAVAGFAKSSVDSFLAYGEQIRGLTALTGTGAEETSRLMQAFDDMGISAEKFATIVESSAKKGFVFTLENVKALADEYKKLPSQVEKNALLQERLGKGASVAAKAFEEGSGAIEEYYNAVSDGLALTDEEIRKADEARRNIDAWNDSWQDFTLTVGGEVTGAMNTVIDRSEKLKQISEETGQQLQYMGKDAQDAAIKTWELANSIEWVKNHSREAKELLGGYSNTVGELPPKLDAAAQANDDLAQSMKAYSDQLLFTIATEGLDVEAKTALAEKMGLIDKKTQFAKAMTSEWRQMLEDGKITVDQYTRLVAGLGDQYDRLTSKDITITTTFVNRYVNSGNTEEITSRGRTGTEIGVDGTGEANGTGGNWVTVPPGYPGDSYPVMMSSGEQYQVVNDRQRWTGQGNGNVPSINFNGPINIYNEMTYQQFRNRLMADLRRGG